MSGLLDVYRATFKLTIAIQLQYRVALVIWLIGTLLEPVIYLTVWTTVARSSGGAVGGFTEADFAAYFIVLMMVNHLTFTWIMWIFEWEVRMGRLSFALLRPVHPIHAYLADNISYKLLTLVVMLPAALLLAVAFRPALHPPAWAIALFVPALALAFLLRYMLEWVFALIAFWTTRIAAFNQIHFVIMHFLSGQLAPLSLLPTPVQVLAAVLPFRWMLAFPVELLLGRLTVQDTLVGLAAQAVWLAICLWLANVVWRAGVRRFSGVGA